MELAPEVLLMVPNGVAVGGTLDDVGDEELVDEGVAKIWGTGEEVE
jgi:hypothetical protein